MTMTETIKTKPWYRRRRFVYPALLLVLAYFCLVPSRLKISPETTLITEPFTPDGRPDYFRVYEKTWASKLSPPEDNGLRMMIAAVGPRMLEMYALANDVKWEDIPKHEQGGKQWFEDRWIPLCEHMYIDPYAKPKFYDSLGFHAFMQKIEESWPKDENPENFNMAKKRHEKLVAEPWKAEEYPEVAEWLKEREPILDLYGIAVRKPNYVCWRPRPEGGCFMILLPDVQSNRDYGLDLQVRVTERLGRGDVDGAWYDVMSMYHLSRRHYCNDSIYVTKLVGAAVERMACQSAAVILKHGSPSREQLDRFAGDLASLPSAFNIDTSFEEMMQLDILHSSTQESYLIFCDTWGSETLRFLSMLPTDKNIAGKRLNRFFAEAKQGKSHEILGGNPIQWQRTLKSLDKIGEERKRKLENPYSQWIRIPLIRTRSELVADLIATQFAYGAVGDAMCQTMARFDLLRIAVALERYEKAENDYPDDLERLVPKYLDEIPLDPFTGRKTITYKRNPEEGSPYLVYSYGRNGEDDGGREAIKNPDASTMHLWEKHDIVFKR